MKRICVIDGQGGGIGSAIIKRLQQRYGDTVEIVALGTNAVATANMLRARANRGASGENAIVFTIQHADLIIGPLGIVLANAMLGEVSPAIAAAVASCQAPKILLPLPQENVTIVGVELMPLPEMVEAMVAQYLGFAKN